MYIQIVHSQFEMAISIQRTASEIHHDAKVGVYKFSGLWARLQLINID
jgi:hypothetical protein